ncbi:YqzK family protein [Virgibacillus sp. NKC19-3]|uniref:YqzK family protein n=1 Tax=Virgibacillus saliphilus TaxID=2831674 RepID=UPI001C9AB3FA|nr:YqzK family protein [Virgibacillus sp. NKC19-3]MBY7143438.1 YqzK family protein [Virgibacillus sp. NKC19-3]
MRRIVWDTCKVFVLFIVCTLLFYFGLRTMHAEYQDYHRYDPPEGPAVKVFNEDQSFIDRLNLFFRLGE